MNVENIKRFQTVSIWIDRNGTCRVRGYYRGCSYLISTHDDLKEAFDRAQQVTRKQNGIFIEPPLSDGGDA